MDTAQNLQIVLVDIILLALLATTALAIVRLRSLFAVVAMSGVFSLLSAGLFVILDAVDVAFTEAAVGAGISTVLMLGGLSLTTRREKLPAHTPALPLLVVSLTGGALVFATLDMPAFGDPDAPIHKHVAPEYMEGSEHVLEIPNVVTSVLASYRGFDTLGETVVILTAGIAVLALLGGATRRRKGKPK